MDGTNGTAGLRPALRRLLARSGNLIAFALVAVSLIGLLGVACGASDDDGIDTAALSAAVGKAVGAP